MNKEMIRDFTSGSVMKQLVIFGLPLFAANLLQIVYNMVDMIVVGNVVGQVGLSAVSVGGDITDLLTVLVLGFANAAQVIISQFIGAKQKEKIGPFVGTFAVFLFLAAIVTTAGSILLRHVFLALMHTPEEAYAQALLYETMTISGLVFIYGYNAVSGILRGLGDSKHPFIFIALAAILNIVLDILFVAGMGMGAFGAALATVIGQAVSFLSALLFLLRRRKKLGFEMERGDFRLDRDMLPLLVKQGIPMALRAAAISISKLFINSFVNIYGVTVSAATGVGMKINQIGNLVSNSLNTAGASMVGQNIGAQKYDRVSRIMFSVYGINTAITAVLVAVLLIWPRQVFLLFNSDGSILEVAMEYVPSIVLMLFACAARSGANAFMNGTGNYKLNFAVAILDAVILRVGLGLLFGLGLGMEYRGFWLGNALSGFTPFFIGTVYYLTGKWKTRKFIIEQ